MRLSGQGRVPVEPTPRPAGRDPLISAPASLGLPCQEAPWGRATRPRPGCWSLEQYRRGQDCPPPGTVLSDGEKGMLGGHGEAAGECIPSEHFPPARPPQLWQRATPRSGQDTEPTTCAQSAQGREGLRCPSIYRGAMCCYSNGGISDEWGKLFLLLSRLQKETKTPFTSANNALMWAPVPRSPHKPGSVRAANRHTGLWGPPASGALSLWVTHTSSHRGLGQGGKTHRAGGRAHSPGQAPPGASGAAPPVLGAALGGAALPGWGGGISNSHMRARQARLRDGGGRAECWSRGP